MSKYIPKVGEECEVLNTKLSCAEYEKCMPLYVGKYAIVYTSLSCTERQGSFEFCNFRPIQTKADVERELLKDIIEHCRGSFVFKLEAKIQQAGFTIPKKISKMSIYLAIASFSMTEENCELLHTKICNLLGDLVEQDKGGAE
jgi:hypothetical protein